MKDKPAYYETLRERLNRLLLATGMSRSSLARAIGRKPNSMTRYLDGKVCPPPDMIHKIAEALEVDWRVLIGELPLPPEAAVPSDSEAPPGPGEGAGQGGRLHPFTRGTEASINEPRAGRIRRAGKTGKRI